MSVPIVMSGYAPALGADITNVSASLTLSTDSGDNGHVEMLIDSEIIEGDKSGTTVSNLTRATEKFNGTALAASHTKGAIVYFILGRQQLQALGPTKIDEATGADFPAASITFPLHGSAFPTGGHLEIIYDLRDTSGGTTNNNLNVQFNADAGANYSQGQIFNNSTTTVIYNEGTAATSMVVGLVVGGGAAASWSAKGRIQIPNFSGATIKQAVGNVGAGFGPGATGTISRQSDGTWNSTAAITAIKIFPPANNLAANSLISLYRWP